MKFRSVFLRRLGTDGQSDMEKLVGTFLATFFFEGGLKSRQHLPT
jgi:hypothetical protein